MQRRRAGYLLLCILLLGCSTGNTQPPSSAHAASTLDLIAEGKGLLQRGRRLDRVITLFQEAVTRESEQAEYRTYLGTAYAARAFALARYIELRHQLPDRQMQYGEYVQEWQRIQKIKGHPLAFLPPPLAPFPINPPEPKDEKQSDAALREEILRLADIARNHLAEGSLLLEQNSGISTEKRGELRNLQGWAAVLLVTECYRDAANTKKAIEVRKLIEVTLEDALEHLTDDSQRLSTADAFILTTTYKTAGGTPLESGGALLKRGLTLLEEVAPRARNRGAIYYWVGLQKMRLDEAAVIDALSKAARYDKTNAIYHYTYAAALIKQRWPQDGKFREEDSREILTAMRNGNGAPSVRYVAYAINTPKLLRWTFADYAPDSIEITSRLGGFAELEFRRILEQTGDTQTPEMTKELAKAGILFYKSFANGSFSTIERQQLSRTGRLLLSLTGTLVAAYRIRTGDRTALPELGFTLLFTTPNLQQMVEKL